MPQQQTDTYRVRDHFSGRSPLLQAIYDRLIEACSRFGAVIEEAHKTSIHLKRDSAFTGVAVRSSYIILTIKDDEKNPSERIVKSERVSKGRYHHEVRLENEEQVDRELIRWLRKAYALSK